MFWVKAGPIQEQDSLPAIHDLTQFQAVASPWGFRLSTKSLSYKQETLSLVSFAYGPWKPLAAGHSWPRIWDPGSKPSFPLQPMATPCFPLGLGAFLDRSLILGPVTELESGHCRTYLWSSWRLFKNYGDSRFSALVAGHNCLEEYLKIGKDLGNNLVQLLY